MFHFDTEALISDVGTLTGEYASLTKERAQELKKALTLWGNPQPGPAEDRVLIQSQENIEELLLAMKPIEQEDTSVTL